jgi:hypothetical protein
MPQAWLSPRFLSYFFYNSVEFSALLRYNRVTTTQFNSTKQNSGNGDFQWVLFRFEHFSELHLYYIHFSARVNTV